MARMVGRNGRTAVVLAVALIGALIATAQPVGAADECTYSFQNNEAPDLKIKKVIDGREVTQILLTSGRTESITVTADDTVVVRRPSDRERLYRASGCEGAGQVIDLGELPAEIGISCSVDHAVGAEQFRLTTRLAEAPAGSYVAYKAYNPVDDEDYVFLGSFRTNGRTTIVDDLEVTTPGEWRLTSRIRLADGSKLPRVDCGNIIVGGELGFPDGVIGNRNVDTLPTSCWAVDKQLADGSIVSDVTILNAGDPRVVYARTDTRFLGSIDERGGDYDPRIDLVKVRGGDRQGTYDCQRGWTGDAAIISLAEDEGASRVEVDVMLATPAANGGTNVVWSYGVAGPAFGNGGGLSWSVRITNTLTGETVRSVVSDGSVGATLVDCDLRYAVIEDSFFGETYPRIVNLETGEATSAPRFLENSRNYGFDCDGGFWYEATDGVRVLTLDP